MEQDRRRSPISADHDLEGHPPIDFVLRLDWDDRSGPRDQPLGDDALSLAAWDEGTGGAIRALAPRGGRGEHPRLAGPSRRGDELAGAWTPGGGGLHRAVGVLADAPGVAGGRPPGRILGVPGSPGPADLAGILCEPRPDPAGDRRIVGAPGSQRQPEVGLRPAGVRRRGDPGPPSLDPRPPPRVDLQDRPADVERGRRMADLLPVPRVGPCLASGGAPCEPGAGPPGRPCGRLAGGGAAGSTGLPLVCVPLRPGDAGGVGSGRGSARRSPGVPGRPGWWWRP